MIDQGDKTSHTDAVPTTHQESAMTANAPGNRPVELVSDTATKPSAAMRRAMAEAALNRPDAHLYGAVAGPDGTARGDGPRPRRR